MGVGGTDNRSDEELLSATALDMDIRAFGVLYDRYEDPLLAFFRRATGRAELAADLTAEVFAQALASATAFRVELGSAHGWLFGIARHELARLWQHGRVQATARARLGMERMTLTDGDLERIDEIGSSQHGEAALELLSNLPAVQQHAIRARVLEERDYDDLARESGCSELVVRQRVSRGLRTLRKQMEQRQ